MGDEERRRRARAAKAEAETVGTNTAELERDEARERRYREDPYELLLNQWVLVQGVREHYRGHLVGVTHYAGGARLVFDTLYHLDDFSQESPALGDGGQKLETPAILHEGGVLMICPQPRLWPKS